MSIVKATRRWVRIGYLPSERRALELCIPIIIDAFNCNECGNHYRGTKDYWFPDSSEKRQHKDLIAAVRELIALGLMPQPRPREDYPNYLKIEKP